VPPYPIVLSNFHLHLLNNLSSKLLPFSEQHEMVLRGSNIKPEGSLRELQVAIQEAEHALESTTVEIEEARQDAYEQLADEDVDQMSNEELRAMVNSLHSRVAQLEQQSQEDARIVAERYAQLTKTLQQLGAGGVAGAIARSFVAPVDRVKILMQTSYLTGNEAKFRSIGQTSKYGFPCVHV
jgi:chromosome segregation ATPase